MTSTGKFMWPFKNSSPDEMKMSRAHCVVALGQLGKPQWSPRNYNALAQKGYAQNPVVYRCVRMISEAAASVPLYVFDAGMSVDEHPLLALLRNPNPRQAGASFFEALIGHLLIAGDAYVEAVKVDETAAELYPLRPDRMRVIPGAEGWPQAYDYVVGNSTIRFRQDAEGMPPILHLSLFHPLNDHYGLAPLEAAATALDILNAASAWHKALLDNSARPSGALVYAPSSGATLSREQFERLKEELEQSFSGAANAGRPLLLEGGLDWRAMSLTPKDMDFIETRNAAARDVALAFGVPPMLLGIPGDATYANYSEANRAFWRQGVLPLLGRITQSLAHWLKPAFGDADLRFDADAIPALASDREALWKQVGEASFLTDDEKREAVGYSAKNERKRADFFKYSPDQPRVPAGSSDGGQWTNGGGSSSFGSSGSASRDIFRRKPEGEVVNAQFTPRGPRGKGGAGLGEPTLGQQARLAAAEANARDAIRRVQEVDPNFRPSASLTATGSIEGDIAKFEAHAREAQTRLAEIYARTPPSQSGLTDHGNIRVGDRQISQSETQEAINSARQKGNVMIKTGKYGTPQVHYRGSNGLTVIVETAGRNAGKVITFYRHKN
jgi:HK97 family phage portal protein